MDLMLVEHNETGDEVATYVSSNGGNRIDIIVRHARLPLSKSKPHSFEGWREKRR